MVSGVGLPGSFYPWPGLFCAGRGGGGGACLWTVKWRGQLVTAAIMKEPGDGEQAVSAGQISNYRQAFDPAELDQFSSGFSQDESLSGVTLVRAACRVAGECRVNSDTGEIWVCTSGCAGAVEYRGLPVYTGKRGNSRGVYSKLHGTFGETILQPGATIFTLIHKERGAVEYNFNYARVIEGCALPG